MVGFASVLVVQKSNIYVCIHVVRLGNSGLKVSRIILGTAQYGSREWQCWVLEEEEAMEHIKSA